MIELPAVLIGIVPIYNLPGVHTELRFSGELLAEIFLGEVKTWNAPGLRSSTQKHLYRVTIKVIYRPAGKGSNYVFSEFLSKTSSKFRTQIGTSPSPSWPVGVPAERSSDMADKVKSETGSIGYVDVSVVCSQGQHPTWHGTKRSREVCGGFAGNDQSRLPRGRGAGVGQVFSFVEQCPGAGCVPHHQFYLAVPARYFIRSSTRRCPG